jgi:hypothetical protein
MVDCMSAIDQVFTFTRARQGPRLKLWIAAPARKPVRLERPLAEAAAPVAILVLLFLIGLIWLAVGGAVMRGTR